jgi:hypothetical protein
MNKYNYVPKLIFAFIGIVVINQLQAAAVPQYQYKSEAGITNKRKIGILAYGSLVHQSVNVDTGAMLQASAFVRTPVTLPVSMLRLSSAGKPTRRITAVIDNLGQPKNVYVATSGFAFLPNARNNLAAREGAPYYGQGVGYDLNNIFYMKKLQGSQSPDNNEARVDNTDWVIRRAPNPRQQIPPAMAAALARWADSPERRYDALIWASFPPNCDSQDDVVQKLISDTVLLNNTKEYIRNLPEGPQTQFEQFIVNLTRTR